MSADSIIFIAMDLLPNNKRSILQKFRYYVAVAQNLKYTLNRSKIFDALNC